MVLYPSYWNARENRVRESVDQLAGLNWLILFVEKTAMFVPAIPAEISENEYRISPIPYREYPEPPFPAQAETTNTKKRRKTSVKEVLKLGCKVKKKKKKNTRKKLKYTPKVEITPGKPTKKKDFKGRSRTIRVIL